MKHFPKWTGNYIQFTILMDNGVITSIGVISIIDSKRKEEYKKLKIEQT